MSDRLRSAVIVVVLVVWAANFTAPLVIRDYVPRTEIHLALMGIIGVLTYTYRGDRDQPGDRGDGDRG